MWKWIVSKCTPGHALDRELASPRSRARLIAELPAESPAAALESVTLLFDSSPEWGVCPEVRVQALLELDDFVQPFRSELFGHLIANSPKQVLSEPAWKRLAEHHRALAVGCEALLEALGPECRDSRLHARRTAAACRGMRAAAKWNMLLRMRYQNPPADLWSRLERMYIRSSGRAQSQAAIVMYPGEPEETTLLREYLVALLFDVAPLANLLPAQIHGVDLLLRRHAGSCRMGDAYDEVRTPFVFDAASGARPARWLPGTPRKRGARFFGLGDAFEAISRERQQAGRSTPPWIAASQLSLERYRALLDRLIAQWGLRPPARRQRRDIDVGELLIARDFSQVRRLIQFSELARSGRSTAYDWSGAVAVSGDVPRRGQELVQPKSTTAVSTREALESLEKLENTLEAGAIETWTLVNSSEEGLGIEVVGKGGWAKVGTLIAYRRPESAGWLLAVVRWLSHGTDERMRLGLRKIDGVPYAARVQVNDPRQSKASKQHAPALNYDGIELDAQVSCVLLAPGVFDPSWRYTLTVGHRWDFVRMHRCVECGLDFEQVEFRVVGAQQAA